MRVTISGLLLSCVAVAELFASTSSLKIPPPGSLRPAKLTHTDNLDTRAPRGVEPFQQEESCISLLDLVAVVDASGSIQSSHFRAVLDLLSELLETLPISREEVHMSLMIFSTSAHVLWTFKDPEAMDPAAAREEVQRIKQPGGRTNTAKALKLAGDLLFGKDTGARANVPKVVFLLTDGESDDRSKTSSAAKSLRQRGVVLAVLGVGDNVNSKECKAIVGCKPSTETSCPLYKQSRWEGLASSLFTLLRVVCKQLPMDARCGPWTPWSPCSATCGEGTQMSYRQEISPATSGTPPCPTCPAPHGRSCAENGGVVKTQSCFERDCDENAGCGEWGPWGPWSQTCESATRTRKRTGYNHPLPKGGGLLCQFQDPPKHETESEMKYLGSCDEAAGQPGGASSGGDVGSSGASDRSVYPHSPDDGSNSDGGSAGGFSPSEERNGGGGDSSGGGSGGAGSGGGVDVENSTASGPGPEGQGEGTGSGPEGQGEGTGSGPEGQGEGTGSGPEGHKGGESNSPDDGGHHHQQQQPESQDQHSEPEKKESNGVPAAAIAGGVVGALFLAGGGAGAAYYYYKGGGSSATAQPPVQYDDMATTKDVAEEEREAMITIGDESNMWADH